VSGDPREPRRLVPLRPGEDAVRKPRLSPPGRLHGLAIVGMSACAVVGIVATLAFITVGWPGNSGRRVIAVVVFAAIGFLACASTAVLSAARDTYPRRPARPEEGSGDRLDERT